MNVIEITNLTKDYGDNKGVFDISFSVEKGEVFGFLGPNGAGKTTTLRHLMGFVKAESGECRINQTDCFADASLIQNDIGYIPGEISFMDNLNGLEFIKFIAEYRGLKDLTYAYELIKLFELNTSGKIKKMSKGMKQKLGIIVALMHDPSVLILDEPTSGLDPLMQNRFVELIKREKDKGKTILMSSHMFEEIERTCTKVAIIKDGKIVTIDDIFNLKKSKSRKYTITFENSKDCDVFKNENINVLSVEDSKITVLVQNNINELIEILSKYNVLDFVEEYQSLESVFMGYYGDNND